jgi:hypothetical protein
MNVKEILDKHGIQYCDYVNPCSGGTKCVVCGSMKDEHLCIPAIITGRKCMLSLPEGSLKLIRAKCIKCGSPYYIVQGNVTKTLTHEYYLTVRDSFNEDDVVECNW